MRKSVYFIILGISLGMACKQKEIFEGKATMDAKFFLNTNTFVLDNYIRCRQAGFKYLEVKQIPGQKADTTYPYATQVDWHYYTEALNQANLCNDTLNAFRYSMQQQEDLANVKVTINYLPNYTNLKVTKFTVILNANDSEVKSIDVAYNLNSTFKEVLRKVTVVPGHVIQVYEKSKSMLGAQKEIIRSMYFVGAKLPEESSIEIVQ